MFLVRADNAWSPSTPPESVSCHVDLRLEKAENRWRTGKRSDAAQRTGTPTSRQQRSENPVKKTSINRNAPMQGIARVGADSTDCACRVGSPMVMVMDWFCGMVCPGGSLTCEVHVEPRATRPAHPPKCPLGATPSPLPYLLRELGMRNLLSRYPPSLSYPPPFPLRPPVGPAGPEPQRAYTGRNPLVRSQPEPLARPRPRPFPTEFVAGMGSLAASMP